MTRSKPENGPAEPVRERNPYCPVCAAGEGKGTSAAGEAGAGHTGTHSCLLSIINAHYLLSKKETGEVE